MGEKDKIRIPPPAPPKIGGEFAGSRLDDCSESEAAPPKAPLLDKEAVVDKTAPSDNKANHNRPIPKERQKNLHNESTPAETKLWAVLQRSSLDGYNFLRQHSVGAHILDFYCPAERLAIVLYGDSHFTDEAIEYDKERIGYLNTLNIRVLRFLNTDVVNILDSFCERILEEIERFNNSTPS